MHYTTRVMAINYFIIIGVEQAQLLAQPFKTLVLKALLHPLTHLVGYRWYVVNTIAHGIDIHHAAAGH